MRRITLIVCFLVLATIAVSSHLCSVNKAEEAIRVEDTLVLQQAIHAYTVDTGKAPQSLDDLVKAGYLQRQYQGMTSPLKVTPSSRKMDGRSLPGESKMTHYPNLPTRLCGHSDQG